jgi:ketosteroid isomerase-like protein
MTVPSSPLLILQHFGEMLAAGDAEAAANLFAEDARYDEPPRPPLVGREAILGFLVDFATRHTDASFTVSRAIEDAARHLLAAEWRWEYTRKADGERRIFEGMAMVEFRDGRIASWRGFSALVNPR